MEESEKTMALKRAYAEIILNTAKEAAARVLVSEKKAVRFQQDLSNSRDEALRLLVRLRQMIDAKTMEAEKTSVNQQRKIDELEAQLHEAEDIITDLRAELSYVQDKLENVKRNQLQPPNVQMTTEDASTPEDLMPVPSTLSPINSGFVALTPSDTRSDILNQKDMTDKCYNALKQDEQQDVPDMTTMLMENKEPELYRNGCTQRIRALERKFPDERLPAERLPAEGIWDPESLLKNEMAMEKNTENEEKCIISSPKTKVMRVKNSSREVVKKPTKRRTSRRKKTRFTRTKSTSRRLCAGQLVKPSQSSSVLSHCRRYPRNRKVKPDDCLQTLSSIKVDNVDLSKGCRESEEELQHKSNCCEDGQMVSQKVKGSMKLKIKDDIASSFKPHLCQLDKTGSNPSASLVTVDVKYGDDQLRHAENEAKIKPLARLDRGLTLIKCDRISIPGFDNNITSVKALGKCRLDQNGINKGMKLGDESVLTTEEGDAKVTSTHPSSAKSSEMISVPLTYSGMEEAKESKDTSSTKVAGLVPLKYTFQRKRKKEPVSDSDGKPSAENNFTKKRAVLKQNDAEDMDKTRSMTEMSRDSRRMAQVARQLISLSGKRWP